MLDENYSFVTSDVELAESWLWQDFKTYKTIFFTGLVNYSNNDIGVVEYAYSETVAYPFSQEPFISSTEHRVFLRRYGPELASYDTVELHPTLNRNDGPILISDIGDIFWCHWVWDTNEHWIYKYNSDASAVYWIKSFGLYTEINDMVFGPDQDIYSTGNIINSDNAFLAKVNPDGDLLWEIQWGEPHLAGADQLFIQDNYIYVTGRFTGQVDFDPGPGEWLETNETFESNAFLAIFDLEGHFQSAYTWGTGGDVKPEGLVVAEDGTVYVTGTFTGVADLAAGDALDYRISDDYYPERSDAFLYRFDF